MNGDLRGKRPAMVTIRERGAERQIPLYGPGEEPPAVRVAAPAPLGIAAPLIVQTQQRLTTSHVDRAKGFSIVSIPLAAGVGVGGLLLAIGIYRVPVLSMTALLVLFLGFLGAWLIAYLWYVWASPDGVVLWQVLLHYRLLAREQKARLRRMDGGR
ncbi:MAG: hypothetical protein M9936_29055 [Caldilinea sp.]|nr:hypothetical protein [Caldilineaceae bacterium]MCO5213767.1 hypothetical protein [Caldilinea sp.]